VETGPVNHATQTPASAPAAASDSHATRGRNFPIHGSFRAPFFQCLEKEMRDGAKKTSKKNRG
jgi:hypothetical protein